MHLLFNLRQRFKSNLQSTSDAALMLALLAVAGVLIVLALLPQHKALKAGALAWTVLP